MYPPFDGFQLSTSGQPIKADMNLELGILLGRFGSEHGLFVGAAGALYSQRSLPPSNLNAMPNDSFPINYHIYEVARPFVVVAADCRSFWSARTRDAVCDVRKHPIFGKRRFHKSAELDTEASDYHQRRRGTGRIMRQSGEIWHNDNRSSFAS